MTDSPPEPGHMALPATKRRKRASQGPNFLFVKYEDRKTALTRSQLRSHAMLSSIREKKRHSYSERDHDDQGAGSWRHVSDVSTTSENRNLDRNSIARTTIWELAVNRVDPFDVLPMRGADVGEVVRAFLNDYPGITPLSDDKLITHSNQSGQQNLRWDNTMWDLLSSEEASFGVLLYGTNLVRDTVRNRGISLQTSTYLGHVMKRVREDMPTQNGEKHISEQYVVAVAGLAAGASVCGHWAAAMNHIEGMLALVRARGGFETFKRFAQRTLIWCELHVRSTQVTLPALRRSFTEANQRNIPPEFLNSVRKLHEKTLSCVPQLLQTETGCIVRGLHFVSLAQKLPWERVLDKVALSDVLDDTGYRLIAERVRLEESGDGQRHMIYAAVTQAAEIYLWGALGEILGRRYAMNGLFGKRMKNLLSAQPLYSAWKEETSVALLWVLFMGWNISAGTEEHVTDWFEEWLFAVLTKINVTSENELRLILGEFPWTDVFCQEPCRLLWDKFVTCQDFVEVLQGSLF